MASIKIWSFYDNGYSLLDNHAVGKLNSNNVSSRVFSSTIFSLRPVFETFSNTSYRKRLNKETKKRHSTKQGRINTANAKNEVGKKERMEERTDRKWDKVARIQFTRSSIASRRFYFPYRAELLPWPFPRPSDFFALWRSYQSARMKKGKNEQEKERKESRGELPRSRALKRDNDSLRVSNARTRPWKLRETGVRYVRVDRVFLVSCRATRCIPDA